MHPGDYPLKVLWTAHRTRTSDETFKFMCALVRRKAISRFVDGEPRRANGQQEIVFVNGSRIMFGARENGFGRGFDSVDIEVFDEAQILTERALDDMIPATNAARNPLIAYMGTPPKPSDPSEVFSMRRDEALKGDSADMLYVEFSADKDADLNDRRQWAVANPSYPHRTGEAAILRMKKNLGDDSFRRDGLGIWDETTVSSAINPKLWVRGDRGRWEAKRIVTNWPEPTAHTVHQRSSVVASAWKGPHHEAVDGIDRHGLQDAGTHGGERRILQRSETVVSWCAGGCVQSEYVVFADVSDQRDRWRHRRQEP